MDEGGWGVDQPRGIDEVPPASGAQTDGDEGFPARVAARDRRAFAEEVFDRHAEEIYRYVLAWTGDSTVAYDLTAQVLRGAFARMEQLAEPEADLEARLLAVAREAVARRSEAPERSAATGNAGAFAAPEPVPFLLGAVAQLDDSRREVVILRQLLGHSTEHTARLLAFDPPVVEELERDACASVWRRVNRAPQTKSVTTWEALTVGAALRQGAPTWLAPPDRAVMGRLREQLLGDLDPDRKRLVATASAGGRRRLLSDLADFAVRRRWLLASGVASAAAGIVVALVMGGPPGQSSSCGTPPCLVATTAGGGVADTGVSLPPPQAEQPGALPSSSTQMGAGSGLPPLTSGGSVTSGPVATTTTPRGTNPAPSTTRPRQPTTTTKPAPSTTTAPTTTQPPTTLPPPTSTP